MDQRVQLLLSRLSAECTRLGGELVVKPMAEWEGRVSHAPFQLGLGLDWDNQEVYVDPERTDTPSKMAGAIHEMGHVFAQRVYMTPELAFLGWEFAMAIHVRHLRAWFHNMSDYEIPHGPGVSSPFTCVPPKERMDFLRERLSFAKRQKLVVDGVPTTVRDTRRKLLHVVK